MRVSNAVEYTGLLITENSDDRSRVVLAFVKTAAHVRLCIAGHAAEAHAYLRGAGTYADRDAYPMPQLILLDLELPQKSGLKILQWLKRERASSGKSLSSSLRRRENPVTSIGHIRWGPTPAY